MVGLLGLVESGTCVVISVLDPAGLPEGTDTYALSRPDPVTAARASATVTS